MYNLLLACDSTYYNNWAINCIKSIQHHVPWINITAVVVNPSEINEIPNVRYVYDNIIFENKDSEIAYYQAIRFIKCAELFPNNELVMSIDCDTILTKSFSEKNFKKVCSEINVQRHQKADRWMAGLVTYGNNSSFRNKFREKLLSVPVNNWSYGWDQKVLNDLSKEFNFNKLEVGDWMSFGKGSGIFLTLKGDQKSSVKYLDQYKTLTTDFLK